MVGATDSTRLVSAIGVKAFNELVDYAEVSDLTVDCNMGENRGMAVGAVGLIGSHTRVRRVRAINFGTEAPPECFVLVVGGGHGALPEMADCVIEDCMVEQPWENNTHETTCLQVSHGEDPTTGLPGHVRAGVLRDNYVNCEYLNGKMPELARKIEDAMIMSFL